MIHWKSRFSDGQLYHPLSFLAPQEARYMLTQGKICTWSLDAGSPGGGGWTRDDWVRILPGGIAEISYLFSKPV